MEFGLRILLVMNGEPKRGYCWCGCGTSPEGANSRFVQGHDETAVSKIEWAVREDWMQDLSPALRWYGKRRGLLEGDEPSF